MRERAQVLEELAAGLEDGLSDTLSSAKASRVADEGNEAAGNQAGRPGAEQPATDARSSLGVVDGAKTGRGKGRHGFGISVASSLDVVLGLVGALVVQQAEMNDSVARTALDTMNV